jgi:hypothetical protein
VANKGPLQIGTADEGKCSAVDAMLLMVGLVLGGGSNARTHAARLPITCGRRAAVEGKRGRLNFSQGQSMALGQEYPQALMSGLNWFRAKADSLI